jgi:MFS family permease
MGRSLDRFGRGRSSDLPMRLLAAGLALTAVGALVALTTHVAAISLAAYAVVLLALGAAAPASLVQLQAVTPERLRASVTAIYLALVTGIGFGVGPPVVGVMSDRLFGPGRHLPAALLSFVLAACLVGLVGAVAPSRPKRHAA